SLALKITRTRCLLVYLIDCMPDELPESLPSPRCLTIWFSENMRLTAEHVKRLPQGDRIFVSQWRDFCNGRSFGLHMDQLTFAGVAGKACVERMECPSLVKVDAKDVGLNLASHEALWNAAASIHAARLTSWMKDDAAALLVEAEEASGV